MSWCGNMQINYSGLVEWRSRGDILIRFDESGEASTHTTSVTISSLTPDTEYRFGVYAVTEKGRGAEVAIRSKTDRATAGEYVAQQHAYVALCDIL